ncbi:MAG: PDZ domain-containing protein [Planctomycetes bacterium]|nr:PDZ domain-containing protein [Planctomycetota bacterium]
MSRERQVQRHVFSILMLAFQLAFGSTSHAQPGPLTEIPVSPSANASPPAAAAEQPSTVAKSARALAALGRIPVRRPLPRTAPALTEIFGAPAPDSLDPSPAVENDRLPLRGVGLWLQNSEQVAAPEPLGYAAGVVFRHDLVATNYHVIGDPAKYQYWVWIDGQSHTASVRAADPWTDLAVLKIEGSDGNFTPLDIRPGQPPRTGLPVIAVGPGLSTHAPPRFTSGNVTGTARKAPSPLRAFSARSINPERNNDSIHHYGTMIQTDLQQPLGISGAALLSLNGDWIGLTTSIASVEGEGQPAGLAIPIDELFQRTINSLAEGICPDYGFLGIAPVNSDPQQDSDSVAGSFVGVLVQTVVPGTPAHRAGLKPNDLISEVAGRTVRESTELIREISSHFAGDSIELKVARPSVRGTRRASSVQVTLAKKPPLGVRRAYAANRQAAWRGIVVDYATAVPEFQDWMGRLDADGCVVVLDVDRDSAAWRAGIRPLLFVSHVAGSRVFSPQEFSARVQELSGEVELRITGVPRDAAIIVVPP